MNATQNEELEGLGNDDDAGWGDYPIDTVLIRDEPRSVFEVVRRIDQGRFIMNPDFQRDFIWDKKKQSKLIESVLMRIPLPVFYLAEDPEGNLIVVDGLQRLTTFVRFLDNELKLSLSDNSELNGQRFEDLSPKHQNYVEDCTLVLYVIDSKVPERARLDIFERVNSGEPLTRQQMRNCLYMGKATRFLRDEADTDLFETATGNSLSSKTMRDREFVNRFCAFQLLSLDEYKGDMDDFLAQALTKMNELPDNKINKLSARFHQTLHNNYLVFGKHAFRKHTAGQERRSVLNASLWDIMSTGLTDFSENDIEAHADELQAKFYELMDDEDFIRSITYSTNRTSQVQHRFSVMEQVLAEVFDA